MMAGLAIAAFTALGRPGSLGNVLAAATTVVGLVDLVVNVFNGIRLDAADHIGGLVMHVRHAAPSCPMTWSPPFLAVAR